MSNATPETDQQPITPKVTADGIVELVPIEHARRMECERNEAREELENWKAFSLEQPKTSIT
jgi:hypothetical protein